VDSPTRIAAALHVCGGGYSDPDPGNDLSAPHSHRHFSQHQHPVVSIIWNYTGLAPQDMANRIISLQERNLTTTVNDIAHLESQSLSGVAVIKVFFNPGANISTAIAQIAGQSQTQLKQLSRGTTAPLIITYSASSASSVPILQLALSSPTLSEQQSELPAWVVEPIEGQMCRSQSLVRYGIPSLSKTGRLY
jgi:multidrug efflux pump subunit AcrB